MSRNTYRARTGDDEYSSDSDSHITLGTRVQEGKGRGSTGRGAGAAPPLTLAERQQIAVDEEGRRRFHGAFTGGFSAGYYNTVGSKEGWAPSSFTSSRSSRATGFQQRAEDYMDEEDLRDAVSAGDTLTVHADYSGGGRHQRKVSGPNIQRGDISGGLSSQHRTPGEGKGLVGADFGFGTAAEFAARKRKLSTDEASSGASLMSMIGAQLPPSTSPDSMGMRLLKTMGLRSSSPASSSFQFSMENEAAGAKKNGVGYDAVEGAPEFQKVQELKKKGRGDFRSRSSLFGSSISVYDDDDTNDRRGKSSAMRPSSTSRSSSTSSSRAALYRPIKFQAAKEPPCSPPSYPKLVLPPNFRESDARPSMGGLNIPVALVERYRAKLQKQTDALVMVGGMVLAKSVAAGLSEASRNALVDNMRARCERSRSQKLTHQGRGSLLGETPLPSTAAGSSLVAGKGAAAGGAGGGQSLMNTAKVGATLSSMFSESSTPLHGAPDVDNQERERRRRLLKVIREQYPDDPNKSLRFNAFVIGMHESWKTLASGDGDANPAIAEDVVFRSMKYQGPGLTLFSPAERINERLEFRRLYNRLELNFTINLHVSGVEDDISGGNGGMSGAWPDSARGHGHGPVSLEEQIAAVKSDNFGRLTRTVTHWAPAKLLCKRFNLSPPKPLQTSEVVSQGARSADTRHATMIADLVGADSSAGELRKKPTASAATSSFGPRVLGDEGREADGQVDEEDDKPELKPDMQLFKAIFSGDVSDDEDEEALMRIGNYRNEPNNLGGDGERGGGKGGEGGGREESGSGDTRAQMFLSSLSLPTASMSSSKDSPATTSHPTSPAQSESPRQAAGSGTNVGEPLSYVMKPRPEDNGVYGIGWPFMPPKLVEKSTRKGFFMCPFHFQHELELASFPKHIWMKHRSAVVLKFGEFFINCPMSRKKGEEHMVALRRIVDHMKVCDGTSKSTVTCPFHRGHSFKARTLVRHVEQCKKETAKCGVCLLRFHKNVKCHDCAKKVFFPNARESPNVRESQGLVVRKKRSRSRSGSRRRSRRSRTRSRSRRRSGSRSRRRSRRSRRSRTRSRSRSRSGSRSRRRSRRSRTRSRSRSRSGSRSRRRSRRSRSRSRSRRGDSSRGVDSRTSLVSVASTTESKARQLLEQPETKNLSFREKALLHYKAQREEHALAEKKVKRAEEVHRRRVIPAPANKGAATPPALIYKRDDPKRRPVGGWVKKAGDKSSSDEESLDTDDSDVDVGDMPTVLKSKPNWKDSGTR